MAPCKHNDRYTLRKTIFMRALHSDLVDICVGYPNVCSPLGAWKNAAAPWGSPSVVNADLVCGGNSLKTPKQNCSPPRIRAPTPRRLRSRIVIGLFFSCWAPFCAFPVAPSIPRVIWKIKKRQRHDHSLALYWPRQFWLTGLVQMAISLWSSSWTVWTWSPSPAARYAVQTQSHCTWRHCCCLAE